MLKRFLLILLSAHFGLASLRADDSITFTSPDGRFAVRTTNVPGDTVRELIETKTGQALKELDGPFRGDEPVLWSADSRWVTYANHGGRVADIFVLFWDGTSFQAVDLPPVPDPEIKFRPGRHRRNKAQTLHEYASEKPLRWLPSGALVLESTIENYRLEDNEHYVNYTRRNVATIRFNAKQVASIVRITKEKQKVQIDP